MRDKRVYSIKHSFELIAVFILVVFIGCSTESLKQGMGGKGSAQVIEKTAHPPFPEGVACYVCHKSDYPAYEFHKNYGKDCAQCHVKETWMAQKYPHLEWILDDYHRTRCTRCHVNSNEHNYTSYQCYGCHHEEMAMKKVHSDKNINDITNCITCHKKTAGD